MIDSRSNTAPGQMAGYLYQLERALLNLSKSGTGLSIGIETLDDVSIYDTRQGSLLAAEQNKSSISSTIPYGDRSEDLWKTIRIWKKMLQDAHETGISDTSLFFLVTNKSLSRRRLAYQISEAEGAESIESVIRRVQNLSEKCSESVKVMMKEFLDTPKADLYSFIRRIKLLDGRLATSSGSGLYSEVADALHIPSDLSRDEIVRNLFGWLVESCLAKWRKQEPAWITVESFNRQYYHLLERFNSQRARELTKEMLSPLTLEEAERHNEYGFVRQLEWIEANENQIFQSIEDFVFSYRERMRMVQEGYVNRNDFVAFERRLKERWERIFIRGVRSGAASKKSQADTGLEIFEDTIDHREPLGGVATQEYYLTSGCYHRLANSAELGWHPEYEAKFSNMGGSS